MSYEDPEQIIDDPVTVPLWITQLCWEDFFARARSFYDEPVSITEYLRRAVAHVKHQTLTDMELLGDLYELDQVYVDRARGSLISSLAGSRPRVSIQMPRNIYDELALTAEVLTLETPELYLVYSGYQAYSEKFIVTENPEN